MTKFVSMFSFLFLFTSILALLGLDNASARAILIIFTVLT
jgi:hypothetical protein